MAAIQPYDLAGPIEANALVLVHGMTMNRGMWALHARILSERYRVISVDLPGHGSMAGIPYALERAAELLADVLRRETRGQALVVGDSLGGYSALALADAFPASVRALVLSSCSLDMRGAVGVVARLSAPLMERLTSSLLLGRRYAAVAEARLRADMGGQAAALVMELGVRQASRPEVYRALAGRDFPSMVRRFQGPILFLNGERDLPYRRHETRFLAAARDGRLKHLPGVGHTGSQLLPDAFTAAILEFAGSVGW